MPPAFMPTQHYDDFTLSSAGERSDYEEQPDEDEQPFPLKSTLPSQYRASQSHTNNSKRPTLPKAWIDGQDVLQRDFARTRGQEDDVTLSTDVGTAVDEYVGASPERIRTTTTIYEDDSFIPGVGRGHQRTGGMGASSYSAHRDILTTSQLPMHPSPATASRHEQMRMSTGRNNLALDRRRPSPLSSITSDGEDSESGNETTSTSTSSIIMQHPGMKASKADSTGNHQAYTAKQQNHSPVNVRSDRPKLDNRALDEMDMAVKKGKAALRQQLPDSPSPNPSRGGTPRQSRDIRSKKENRHANQLQSPSRPSSRSEQQHLRGGADMEAEGSNGSSGYVAGVNMRKPSDGSSTGKKQAGTDGNTTGDTLVDDRIRDYLHSAPDGAKGPFMKLPSGQKMGRGMRPESAVYLPDLTGMSSALESPVKTVLGVQHRKLMPEVIQARLVQTSEARIEEFNELAHYVKSVEMNLDQTQKKVQAVEDTSKRCAKEVKALRNEWSSWRETKGKKSIHHQGEEEDGDENDEEHEAEDDYDGKVKAINEHIAHLTEDLHTYRHTMEQMRAAKEQEEVDRHRKLREKQQRQAEKRRLAAMQPRETMPPSSSPIKQSRFDEEDEATRLEMFALRKQVNKVAKEVERLKNIVENDDHLVKPVAGKSARFAASIPPMHRSIGVGSQSPFARPKSQGMRSSSFDAGLAATLQSSTDLDQVRVRASSPLPSIRGFSDGNYDAFDDEEEKGDDGDETVRPSGEAAIEMEESQAEQEEDVSIQAQSRAERTFEAVKERRRAVDHDEKTCTVCGSKQKIEKRRQARRDRVNQQQAPRSSSSGLASILKEKEEDDEHLLMSLLEAATRNKGTFPTVLPKNSKHRHAVQRLLKEHLDEFYHHRLLYCELADELKQFEPSMNTVKRRILAEHVMEAVEGLEFRAKRINVLQSMVGSTREEGGVTERKRRPRNSPPIVDGGDLYRRVVSA